jgi:hypothetical protein
MRARSMGLCDRYEGQAAIIMRESRGGHGTFLDGN